MTAEYENGMHFILNHDVIESSSGKRLCAFE